MFKKILDDHAIGVYWWVSLTELAQISLGSLYTGTEVTR
jgi:hypothetical protein